MKQKLNLEILKNCPVPKRKKREGNKWDALPWDQMEIGDSVVLPMTSAKSRQNTYISVSMSAARHGMVAAVRIVEDGVQVWRVK